MSNFVWTRTALMLGTALVAGLIVWPLAGPLWAFVTFAAGLAATLAFHLRNLNALLVWLRDPLKNPVPTGSGVWEHVFSALYRLVRSFAVQRSRVTGQLARFRSAAQAMPIGVVVLDNEDRITWCNVTAERMLDLDARKDAGQPILNLVRQPAFADYVKRGAYEEPLTLRISRVEALVLTVRIVQYGQDEKLLLARDITQAEKIEIMRRDFVANVSHELRTPLTVVSGFLETLSDGNIRPEDPRGRQALEMMRSQTDRMMRLVEDLLMLSTLESSSVPARETQIDMEALLGGILEDARALSAGQHQVQLHVGEPARLLGDEQEIRSAFGNLVSNAIRYTPRGGRITLSWGRRGDEGVFSVEDTGIGIESRHISRLTERFYRADTSRSRDTGGTGLGLAIVKHVLTRHQGHLEIESDLGRGSRFSALFPAHRVQFTPRSVAHPELEKLTRS
jgi:two-component system, OmpR family, phosphate regulon sensor histidine kinase PhoR